MDCYLETWANCDSRSEFDWWIVYLETWANCDSKSEFDWYSVYLETWANCDSKSAEFDCPLPEIWLSWASNSDITLSFSSTVFFKASLKITCFSALPRVFSVLRTIWEQIQILTLKGLKTWNINFKGTAHVISHDPGLSLSDAQQYPLNIDIEGNCQNSTRLKISSSLLLR